MIQRYIFSALQSGLLAFSQDASLYQSLFGDLWNLSSTEVAQITQYFTANPPIVSHAYKHSSARFPQYIIMVQPEQQPLFALSDFGGGVLGTTPAGGIGQVAGSYASLWTHNVQIVSQAAKNVELAFYMYEVAKASMVFAKPTLQKNHLDIPTMSGSEVSQAPGASDSGDFIFQRVLTFRCQREFKVKDSNGTANRVYSVAGVERPTALAAADELQLVSITEALSNG